jgi:hypothetical protein
MKLAWACAIAFSFATVLQGQEVTPPSSPQGTTATDQSHLPDAPRADSVAAKTRSSSSNSSDTEQTKRILGFIPKLPLGGRRRDSAATNRQGQIQDRFAGHLRLLEFHLRGRAGRAQSSNEFLSSISSGYPWVRRYYWHTFADQSDENIWVESILPAAFHEDSRYYTLGHRGFINRTAYSLSRVLITRTDSGTESFNASEIIGAGGAAGISSAYYPSQYCTWTRTGQRWLTNVILDGANFAVREFWPDVHSAFRHHHRD